MAMTEARRNEIAWLALVNLARRQGLHHLKPNEFRREVGNGAKEIGISFDEAMEFSGLVIRPLVEEILANPKSN